MVGANLLRYKKDQLYLVADTETESLNLYFARPWEVGFALFDVNGIKEFHNYQIKWDNLNVSAGARFVTGFSDSEYAEKAEDPKKILEIFEKYLYNPKYIKLGHNWLGFDAYIHNTWRRLMGAKSDYSYLHQTFDTNCLQKAYKLEIKPDQDNLLAWQYRLVNKRVKGLKTGIDACCREFGIPIDESRRHEAKYDCELNIEVFKKQLWKIEI